MRNFKLAKLLRFLFVSALVILCVLLIWAVVLIVLGLDIQWWGKAMILTCLAASVIIAILLRKLILKRREMKFIDGIIGPENMPGNTSSLDEASRELRRRFKQAVATLKKSDLKQKGNPLYVLPWYLMVGSSGAGKSTAVKSARLPSPFGDINRVVGVEGTRNCDWWFFDDSVVIDIAGRYSIHRNEDLDKKEWRTFLEHLVKYRRKEPINGVIVTVEANRLLEGDIETIENEGRTLRKRIDEVTSVMGAKFPVYLMVTKSDLIYGINRYCQLLSEYSVSQAMGLMNHDSETDITVFVNKTVDTITEKLKDIRLILANKEQVQDRHYVEPEVLLFPNEFSRLRDGLVAFCKGAFKDNPFQELPFLRGIYFCSGRQEGRPVSSRAESLSSIDSPELPGTGNGFFLFDFFAKILPADRSLYSLTRHAKEWHRLTHNLWLTGFVTIVLACCIVLTYSWNENKATLNLVSPKYKKAVLFNNDPIDDISLMADFSQEIKAVEERNRNWKIPRLGLNASIELEKILKRRYCRRFDDHFDNAVNQQIESRIANGSWDQDNFAPAVQILPFAVRRINIIQAKFDGADIETLQTMPDPNFAAMIHGDDLPTLESEIADRYKQAYINYLAWQDDIESLNKTLVGMQRLLQNFFSENQGDLRWLIAWYTQDQAAHAITLNRFWYSNADDKDLVSISPAFTVEGHKQINDFVVNELEKAVPQPLWIVKPKEEFVAWYKEAFYNSWAEFALNFGEARALFEDPQQWKAVIERFAGDDSPYLGLLKVMEEQLLGVEKDRWPGLELDAEKDLYTQRWLDQIRDFGIIRKAVASEKLTENKAATEQLSRQVSNKVRIAAKIVKGSMGESKLAKGKQAYKRYQEALQSFNGVTASGSHAYKIVKAGFEDNPAQAKSPVYSAQKAVDNIRTVMAPKEGWKAEAERNPFWHLITEPVDVLWRFSVQQAGCHLQEMWDREVIVKTEGVYSRHQLVSLLFGEKGYADKFINNHAGPFVVRSSRRGYHTKEVRGCAIPFKKSYFSFIRQGKRWGAVSSGAGKTQVVRVSALPTDVNIEARVKPHMTRLVLDGADGGTVLENRQYPIEKNFSWSPSTSGDVTLQIMLGDITLTRKYTGYCAFGRFLREFKNGKRVFTVHDFNDYRHEFNRLGVNQITVFYHFQTGQMAPIVRMLNTTPGRPPAVIISCAR